MGRILRTAWIRHGVADGARERFYEGRIAPRAVFPRRYETMSTEGPPKWVDAMPDQEDLRAHEQWVPDSWPVLNPLDFPFANGMPVAPGMSGSCSYSEGWSGKKIISVVMGGGGAQATVKAQTTGDLCETSSSGLFRTSCP